MKCLMLQVRQAAQGAEGSEGESPLSYEALSMHPLVQKVHRF